jgi:hypothetical protein
MKHVVSLLLKKFQMFIITSGFFSEMNLLLAIVLLQATILLCSEEAAKAPKGTSTTPLNTESMFILQIDMVSLAEV